MIIECDANSPGAAQVTEALGDAPTQKISHGHREWLLASDAAVGGVQLDHLPGVVAVHNHDELRLATRTLCANDTVVDVAGTSIGDGSFKVVAGPCAVESLEQLERTAAMCLASGAHMLRAGVYKPRTSPFSFQGLREGGAEVLGRVRAAFGVPAASEVTSPAALDALEPHIDMIQVGARNMQNYDLLTEVGRAGMPVLLKRGMTATIDEWLYAAEYVMAGGAPVILCERGIRTFEGRTRFTLDVSAVPVAKQLSHLPVIVDPSHAAGKADLVAPLALAAAAAGADGLLVEAHHAPAEARCDGKQALDPDGFNALMRSLGPLLQAVGKPLSGTPHNNPDCCAVA